MFFVKEKSILYLYRNGFTLYPDRYLPPLVYQFSKEAVVDEEIIDREKLKADITSFISKKKLKPKRLIILLSEEITFSKKIESTDPTFEKSEIEKFVTQVPFEHTKQVILSGKEGKVVIATNVDLYKELINILATIGLIVEAVVPISIFGDIGINNKLQAEELEKIIKGKKIIKLANFLKEEKERIKIIYLTKEKRRVVFSLVFLVTAIFILSLSLLATFRKKTGVHPVAVAEPTITPTSEPTPSPTLKPSLEILDRESVRIQVLNGTGIAGQAAKVNSFLLALGYNNLKTGNAPGASGAETIVVFAKSIPQPIRQEISQALKDRFQAVASQEGEITKQFDIVITTGREK